MIKQLNHFLFRRRLSKVKASKAGEQRFVTYEKARMIFLLFEFDPDKYAEFTKIIDSLRRDGKKVTAWAYYAKDLKKIDVSQYPQLFIFDKKSLDLFGKPLFVQKKKVRDQSFDLLINLSLRRSLPLMYIGLYTRASCKAGSSVAGREVFDFIIDSSAGSEVLDEKSIFEHIIFYLKKIQTTD